MDLVMFEGGCGVGVLTRIALAFDAKKERLAFLGYSQFPKFQGKVIESVKLSATKLYVYYPGNIVSTRGIMTDQFVVLKAHKICQ
eukprot:jgi/Bigna1/136661/aug1.35_g11369